MNGMNEDQIKNVFVFSVMRKVDEIDHGFVQNHSDRVIDFIYDNYDLLHYGGINGATYEVLEQFGLEEK
jgi:hypothetical protein